MKANEDQWNRWIDGELSAEEAAAVEAMVTDNPDLDVDDQAFFARLSGDLKDTLPAERTPPFADFFNSQLQKRLWDLEHPDPVEERNGWKLPSWLQLSWAVPLGAAAAIVIGLTQIGLFGDRAAAQGSQIISTYTPDDGVLAETAFNADANAMVIRLTGIDPLPEGFDLELTKAAIDKALAPVDEIRTLVSADDESPSSEVSKADVQPTSF